MVIFSPWDESFISNQNNYQNIDNTKKDYFLLKIFRSLAK